MNMSLVGAQRLTGLPLRREHDVLRRTNDDTVTFRKERRCPRKKLAKAVGSGFLGGRWEKAEKSVPAMEN